MADAEFWNERYAGADYAYGERPNAFLFSLSDYTPIPPASENV